MGKRFPPLDRSQVERVLKTLGFTVKKKKASHTQWEGYIKKLRRVVTVKKLSRDTDKYGPDLMQSMIRQSGLSKKSFYKKAGY